MSINPGSEPDQRIGIVASDGSAAETRGSRIDLPSDIRSTLNTTNGDNNIHSLKQIGQARFGAAFVLLTGCAQQSQPVVIRYNPPGTALAELPVSNVTWYHVMFANSGTQIDANGQQAINNVAASMQANSALMATVIGKTDSAGGDAANMRLSQQRASAVRIALLQTGKVSAHQIKTRWTGERQQGAQTATGVADPSNRAVDIGVH